MDTGCRGHTKSFCIISIYTKIWNYSIPFFFIFFFFGSKKWTSTNQRKWRKLVSVILPRYTNSHYNVVAHKHVPYIKINFLVPPSVLAHFVAEPQVQLCQAKCFTYFLRLFISCYNGNDYIVNVRKTATSLSGLSISLSIT